MSNILENENIEIIKRIKRKKCALWNNYLKFDVCFPMGNVYEFCTKVHVRKTWWKIIFPYQLLFRLLKGKSWYDHVELPYSIYHLSQLLIVTFTFYLILSCDIFLSSYLSYYDLWFLKDRVISMYEEKWKKNILNGIKFR